MKRKPAAPPARKPGPKSKVSHRGPRGKISPSKTPASKRQYLAACRASSSGRKYKSSYADDSEEEDEEEEEEEEEEVRLAACIFASPLVRLTE